MSGTPSAQAVPLTEADVSAAHLAGLEVGNLLGLDTHGGGIAILAPTTVAEMLSAWQRAREVVDTTQRWPVLVTTWMAAAGSAWKAAFLEEDPFDRFYFKEGLAGRHSDASPAAVLQLASSVELDARIAAACAARAGWSREHIEDVIDNQLYPTERFCGTTPDRDVVRSAAAGAVDPDQSIDRFLMRWEDEHGHTAAMTPAPDDGYLSWFEPHGHVALALLPTADPAAVHAYISSLYDAGAYGHDLVVALATKWRDRYGAEPVALWGTMIEMRVSQPPLDVETAWELACEQAAIADATLLLPGITRRQHARALVGRREWFLHSRP